MTHRRVAWVALALVVLPLAQAAAEPPPLIPREVLFADPERTAPKLSPDGGRLAFLALDARRVRQVWVQTVGAEDAQAVTAAAKAPGIQTYQWAEDGRTLLYLQDVDGEGTVHVHGLDLETKNVRDYTPFEGVSAELVDTHPRFPDQVLVSLNLRKREVRDVHRLNLRNGALELDTANPGDVSGWVTDGAFVIRGAKVSTPDGGTEVRVRDGHKAPWRTLLRAGPDEHLEPIAFSRDGGSMYLESSLGSDTRRLALRNLATGAERFFAEHPWVDLGGVLKHPSSREPQAATFDAGRRKWRVLDPSVQADLEAIVRLEDGESSIVSRSRDDKVWLVGFVRDRGPVRYYRWDRQAKRGTLLFSDRPKLEGRTLAETKHVVIPARDGLDLHSYLTLPPGVPAQGLPMVLFVHGGPWERDFWGDNPVVQWLANRGYAVLQVNFRGSTGFGKRFLHAGDRQWGLKMQDDLSDGVAWAVKQGVADPSRVAIVGGSYGGYAALAGAAFTPETFRCAVDLIGPSNLVTLLRGVPPELAPFKAMLAQRMGNVEDPKDEALLRRVSPLFSADKIRIPVLVFQGANDPRVPRADTEQLVDALVKNGRKVTYVLYPDEGHGFAREENNLVSLARAEAFLAEHLGGRLEPLAGDRHPGSSAVVPVVGGARLQAASGVK